MVPIKKSFKNRSIIILIACVLIYLINFNTYSMQIAEGKTSDADEEVSIEDEGADEDIEEENAEDEDIEDKSTESKSNEDENLVESLGTGEYYEKSYLEYLNAHGYDWEKDEQTIMPEVSVDLSSYTTSDGMTATHDADGVSTGEWGKITWSFSIEKAGFYNIEIDYLPIEGSNSQIERKLYINDEVLFKGMEQIAFKRLWDNYGGEPMMERNDNEIRPVAAEELEWRTIYIDDAQRRTLEPYKFYFDRGTHTLTLESIKEPMKIGAITLKTAPEHETYEDTIEDLKSKYPIYDGSNITYQAERLDEKTKSIRKSSQVIGLETDYSSPATVPYHPYKIKFNTIGGENWRVPGDFIEWAIDVPEEGLYRLSFRAKQNFNRGVASYRMVEVNGELPFKEAMKISFPFDNGFNNYVICDETGEEYLLYFKEGINTIKLEAVLGEFAGPLTEVEESMLVLNDLYRKTIQITGVVPDKFIDYEIAKKIPEFTETLKNEGERLNRVVEELVRITGEKGEKTAAIEKMAIQAKKLSQKPEEVITELNAFENNISALGTWIISISEMPLEIDSFTLSAPNAKLPKADANFVKRLGNSLVRFVSTFFIDETKLDDVTNEDAVTVWVPTGRDQAQIVKNLIDSDFSPRTDISVDLQLIPMDVVLPATLAGTGPDVVLNMDQSMVLNFAMRNALVDLSKFDDFDEQRNMFFDSAIETVTFQNGIYALPEQQSFLMMFYRDDILSELGLEPPKTWDEVKEIIPVLQINNYDFWIPATEIYPSIVFQSGGDLYEGEGSDYGIASGLGTDNAMDRFSDLAEFYTSYKLPIAADFANRFRTGEIPIGIADYTTYNQLEVFAPEIRGLWSFAPIPGIQRADGSVDNTVVSGTINTVIMENAKNKEDAWKFMKWWLQAETQVQYGNTLELVMGTAARYATANVDVIQQLPWPTKHLEQLLDQFEATKGVPEMPGGYMTSRMIDYSFRAVVTDGANPREQLYLNVKEIDKELTKKRKEFRLSHIDDEK